MTDAIKPELPPLKPVAWFCAPFGTLKQNPLFRVEGPQSLNWALACYSEIQLSAAVAAAVAAERERYVQPTDEMARAYLEANAAYWRMVDEGPTKPGTWRNGTPHEATMAGLRAALAVAIRATAPKV